MSQQPLRLRNPTQYHLMATQQNLPERVPYRDSPSSEQLEFTDPFPQNMLLSSPGMHDFEDEEYNNQNNSNNMYDNRPINSNMGIPMDIHRRSSIEDQDVIFNQNQMFMPGSLDSGHSLAMSAPANIGYGYPPNQSFNIGAVQSSLDNVAQGNSVGSYEDDYTAQMNMQLMMEKRRRRRESHNAVERRRRDNINDRIQELCSMLPEAALENIAVGPNNKPNKGVILKKSVEQIRDLQQQVKDYHLKIKELEATLEQFKP